MKLSTQAIFLISFLLSLICNSYAEDISFEPFNKHTNKNVISEYGIEQSSLIYLEWISQKNLSNNCSDLIGTCDYYLCRETQKNCNSNGYFISFGYQYCSESMINLSPKVTSKGKTWLTSVATCLQKKLNEIPDENSCSDIKKLAIQSHDDCYTETHFCSLPVKDIYKILKMLRPEFGDKRIIKEGVQVLNECKKGLIAKVLNHKV